MKYAWILILLMAPCNAFIAYDCNDKKTTAAVIDLSEPDKCPETAKTPRQFKGRAQVIHVAGETEVEAIQCLVTLKKVVHRCGYDGLHYGARILYENKPLVLTPQQCYEAHKNGRIMAQKKIISFGKGIYRTVQKSYFTNGYRDKYDKCHYANWVEEGIEHLKSYAIETATILVRPIVGDLDTKTKSVVFENVQTHFQLGGMVDMSLGTIYWNKTHANPDFPYANLAYQGPITYAIEDAQADHLKLPLGIPAQTVAIINNEETKNYASLYIKDKITFGKTTCFSTHINNIMVCPFVKKVPQVKALPTIPTDINTLLINLDTQLSNLQIQFQYSIRSTFNKVQHAICQQSRKTLFNKLQATANNNQYALMDLYGPGFMATTAGQVVYISKCVPINATFVHGTNCTEEIPALAKIGNTTRSIFVNPITRIITPIPTTITCDPIFPPMAFVDQIWRTLGPAVNPNNNIIKIKPANIDLWLANLTFPIGQGLYNDQQINEHKIFMLKRHARVPIITTQVHELLKGNVDLDSNTVIIDTSGMTLGSITDAMRVNFFPICQILGDNWNYAVAILVLVTICKATIDVAIRLCYTYSQEGCSLGLSFAIWDALWIVIKSPVALTDAAVRNLAGQRPQNNLNKDLEEGEKHEIKYFLKSKMHKLGKKARQSSNTDTKRAKSEPPTRTLTISKKQLQLSGVKTEGDLIKEAKRFADTKSDKNEKNNKYQDNDNRDNPFL